MEKFLQLKNHYVINGIQYPRITSVCSFIDQKGGLPVWAANLGFQAALDGGESGYEAYQKELDRTANFGSAIHHLISTYFQTGYFRFEGMATPVQDVIRQFLSWKKANDLEIISQEITVYSERLKVAGTLDLLCKLNGELTLIDFKTSNGFYASHLTQLAGYDLCLKETQNTHVSQYGILRLPREGDKFDFLSIKDNLGDLRDAFETCKKIYDFSEKTKEILKSSKKKMLINLKGDPNVNN